MSTPFRISLGRCAAPALITFALLAASPPDRLEAQPGPARPDLKRVAHTPRAYSLITRVDGKAGYDAAERWRGIAAGERPGEIVITEVQRNDLVCCGLAVVATDGATATLRYALPAMRVRELQQLLLEVLIEGLPLADGWQGDLVVPEVQRTSGAKSVVASPRLSVPVRVEGRTTVAGANAWRVRVGENTLYVDLAKGRLLGSDQATPLKGHQIQVRERR